MEQLTEELLVKECDNLADELWDEVFGDGDPITPRDFREIVYDVASHFVNRKFVREEGDGADNDLEDEIKKHIQNCLDVKFPTLDVESIKRGVEYTARHFANWQKEQMMKDTVERVKKKMITRAIAWVEWNNRNGSCLFDGWKESLRKEME